MTSCPKETILCSNSIYPEYPKGVCLQALLDALCDPESFDNSSGTDCCKYPVVNLYSLIECIADILEAA